MVRELMRQQAEYLQKGSETMGRAEVGFYFDLNIYYHHKYVTYIVYIILLFLHDEVSEEVCASFW